ncbi:MAG: hypothetical protein H6620_11565 [Halobacteriovoraceae bacterium]|nr:hypothetical protein [Halobacteriovoraceae bacterium]
MKIDYALIYSAGKGSRMGKIGEVLPKPLWPIFERNMLDLLTVYLDEFFGVNNFFVNTHHLADQIEDQIFQYEMTYLYEENLLQNGGTLHSLAARDEIQYKGIALTHNGDQFCFFSKKTLERAFHLLKDHPIVLFGIKVPKYLGHNGFSLDEEGYILDHRLNGEYGYSEMITTFSGTSLIKLDQLVKISGESSFFESVANFKYKRIPIVVEEIGEYWDFGTLDRYTKNLFKLLGAPSSMRDFLIRNNALVQDKIKENLCYGQAHGSQLINLSTQELTGEQIILLNRKPPLPEKGKIYFQSSMEWIEELFI